MNFKTYEDLAICLVKNLSKIPRDVDLIVGIPRSGTLVANMLALYLNLPFIDIDSFLENRNFRTGNTRKCSTWIKNTSEAKHILIVDDSISSGKAITDVKKQLNEHGVCKQITFLAIYALTVSCHKVDIFFEICEQPRMFEWNFMHHWALEYCCMDIDGVLCEDPTRYQNDDGTKYIDFINNATPKFIPTQKIGCLVSCRLEKYRVPTENWLKKHNVSYNQLCLLDGVTAKERAMLDEHATYKAQVYKDRKYILFFESDYGQALEICQKTGKPVFCIANRTLITSDNVMKKIAVRNREVYITLKRVVKKILNKLNYVQ